MAVETKKAITTSPERLHSDIVAVGVLALSVLIFLCLVTYNPNDWNFNTASAQKTQNWIGVVGAVIADLLFQIIGLTAYLIPLLLSLVAWSVFRTKSLVPSVSRVIGYLLFIVSASSLIAMFGWRGGLFGAFFEQNLAWLLGAIGAGILLTAICLASLIIITELSLASFSGNLEMAVENFRIHYLEWKEKRRLAKELKPATDEEKFKVKVNKIIKTPTISNGDAGKIKPKDEKAETPSLLDNLVAPTEKEEKKIESDEDFAEEPPPTISGVEKSAKTDSPFEDLIAATDENIPITPIRQTGDLDSEILDDDAESVEDKAIVETPREPQTYENYVLPHSEFLTPAPPHLEQKDDELLAIARDLTEKTKEFNVTGRVMHICQGPVVTTYEFKPDPGVKYSRVTNLVDDLCLALKAESIRIERIPGKAYVGIEVPNHQRETIYLREVVESKKFTDVESPLTLALGKKIDGANFVADLAGMPHLLIAGATGAGKSVGVNTLVVSILYKAKPDEVKFIMVDPKRLELGVYADIPHLATPIITDPKRAAISLKWAVSEMEKRYKDLAGWGVRNINGYNAEVKKRNAAGIFDNDGEPFKPLPFIVIIIDELADLMMVSGKEVEESITRLAQMARAIGIHLVLATQRPSVDVITGLIKANFPTRISFRVSSKIDSRTIIDGNGAESLLGKGDMLFSSGSKITRVHGAYVDEKEIARIVEHIKAQANPEYDITITKSEEELDDTDDLPGRKDVYFWDAVQSVVNAKRASTSLLQRHLRIGYARAAAILDAMVREGFIGEMDGAARARPILPKAYEALQENSEQDNQQ